MTSIPLAMTPFCLIDNGQTVVGPLGVKSSELCWPLEWLDHTLQGHWQSQSSLSRAIKLLVHRGG